jgi:hypothetical protein
MAESGEKRASRLAILADDVQSSYQLLVGQDAPAEAVAGAIKALQDYASGLMMAEYQHGSGRFILNTLLIRENLGSHPVAERLLRNLLNFGGDS